MKVVFGRTLAREQKLGIYLRLDHKLPDDVYSHTRQTNFNKLRQWSLSNTPHLISTDVLKKWFINKGVAKTQ